MFELQKIKSYNFAKKNTLTIIELTSIKGDLLYTERIGRYISVNKNFDRVGQMNSYCFVLIKAEHALEFSSVRKRSKKPLNKMLLS